MRKILSAVLIIVLPGAMLPVGALAATRGGRQQPAVAGSHEGGGTVQGKAVDPQQQPLTAHVARLRNVGSGEVVRTGQTDGAGEFTFKGLSAGTYVVEIVTTAGNIVGTSERIVIDDDDVAAIVVRATATGSLHAAGSGGLLGLGAAGTAALVAGVAAGVTVAVVATRKDASPKQ